MICKVKNDIVKKMNILIKKQIEKKQEMTDDEFLSRVIWNIFTNNNNERERCTHIINHLIKKWG